MREVRRWRSNILAGCAAPWGGDKTEIQIFCQLAIIFLNPLGHLDGGKSIFWNVSPSMKVPTTVLMRSLAGGSGNRSMSPLATDDQTNPLAGP